MARMSPLAGVGSDVQTPANQTLFVESHLQTARSECLDWVLIWSRRHLHRVLTAFVAHYNTARPHRSLDLQMPTPIADVTALPRAGRVERVDVLGGLIHEYRRAA